MFRSKNVYWSPNEDKSEILENSIGLMKSKGMQYFRNDVKNKHHNGEPYI